MFYIDFIAAANFQLVSIVGLSNGLHNLKCILSYKYTNKLYTMNIDHFYDGSQIGTSNRKCLFIDILIN